MDKLERRAENEHYFRTLNERIEDVADDVFRQGDEAPQVWDFVCECSSRDCTDRVPLTIEEYEHIRAQDDVFVVLPEHDDDAIEVVIDRSARYWLVRKTL